MSEFKGFPPDLFDFLKALTKNNNRDWFSANKDRYYESVVNPMCEFIVAIGPRLKKISKHYKADPRPHGGSMFRIYRDTRFSKDKTPYKTHAASHFRHEAGKDAHAPGFYVHLSTEGLHFGGGIWRPPSSHLTKIRDFIVDNANAWSKLGRTKAIRERGGIEGDSLVRPPRGFDADHQHITDLKRKSFYLMEDAEPELALTPEFIDTVEASFKAAGKLNHFVCDALELPY